MQRWAPYQADRQTRQRATGTTEALYPSTLNQPADSSASQPVIVNSDQASSSNHMYHPVNASGNAFVHQGNNYYHISQPKVTVKEQLLQSLHFREIWKRYDNIDDPHSDTFKWIFEPPDNEQPKWDSFLDWLNGDGGLYWVSGKPGSGKSVLMKHLASNFQQSLKSDSGNVVSLSFWFWEAAHTDLERNMLGCLRSLMWQVLQFPEHCGSIVEVIKDNLPFEWTKRRLRNAFDAVLRLLSNAHVPVLMFLDGLDECGSDTTEVLKFAIGIAKNFPKANICVSSRPEPILQHSLEPYSHLKMQDLNKPDVLAIIQQDLFETPQFATLLYEEREVDRLRGKLIWEAKGVLLWMRLVTKNLVQAVADGDTFPELQTRIDNLPAELDGEHGLYAHMLRRNASSSKAYLADAALYCQIACRDGPVTVLEYYLATNDNLRNSYLQFENGWETLHHQLDCDRLNRAINARTGGLLEVEKIPEAGDWYKLSRRAARTRDPALTRLLSYYRSRNVSFIHRTARSYILETVSGRNLLASSRKSSSEIENLVFEAWLVSFVVLQCLESVAPVSSDILTDIYIYHAGLLRTHTEFEKLESAVNSLASKKYLWLESYRTRSMSLMALSPLATFPFVMTREGRVSFIPILPSFNAPCIANEFQLVDLSLDPAHLLCISFHKIVGHSHNIVERKSHKENCFDLLLSHQPDINYCLTNDFGEQISSFHHMLIAYSRITPNDFFDVVPAFEDWLSRASNETKSRKCEPTMIECSWLFFQGFGGPSFQGDPTGEYFFLGSFDLNDYCNILQDQLRLSKILEPQTGNNTAYTNSNRVHILCMRPSGAWKPKMYLLSTKDFEEAIKQLRVCKASDFDSVGILRSSWGSLELHSWFWATRKRLTELRSLIDVFRHLGKSEAQIEGFIALEEPRVKVTYDEVIYGHWREWLYGIEDQCPEQYRGIRRPRYLKFSVKTQEMI